MCVVLCVQTLIVSSSSLITTIIAMIIVCVYMCVYVGVMCAQQNGNSWKPYIAMCHNKNEVTLHLFIFFICLIKFFFFPYSQNVLSHEEIKRQVNGNSRKAKGRKAIKAIKMKTKTKTMKERIATTQEKKCYLLYRLCVKIQLEIFVFIWDERAYNTKMVCTLHFSAILLFIGFCYVERRSSSPVVFFFIFHILSCQFRFFFS